MKQLFFMLFAFIFFTKISVAQKVFEKPPIDHSVYDKWTHIDNAKICPNGNYITYNFGSRYHSSLIIKSTTDTWELVISNASTYDAQFTGDNEFLVFKKGRDSLGILKLKTRQLEYVCQVNSFNIPSESSNGWMTYELGLPEKKLVLRNLQLNILREYDKVSDYILSNNGETLLCQRKINKDNKQLYELQWIEVSENKATTIWIGGESSNWSFDVSQNKFAFIVCNSFEDKDVYSLLLFRKGERRAVELVNGSNDDILKGTLLDKSFPMFSKDGEYVFFKLKSKNISEQSCFLCQESKTVNIWHYRDLKMQPEQLANITSYYHAVVRLSNNEIIRLELENELLISDLKNGEVSKFVLISSKSYGDRDWWKEIRPSLYLVSIVDGSRRLIMSHMPVLNGVLSPKEKYVIYYDAIKRDYFCLNTVSGILKNITRAIKVPLYDEEGDHPTLPFNYYQNPNLWFDDDKSVLIYDRYDIWKVDPEGIESPLNITNGYGRRNNIVLRPINGVGYNDLVKSKSLMLSAFSLKDKKNGFYITNVGEIQNPQLLSMSSDFWHLEELSPNSQVHYNYPPIKAVAADIYIVRKASVNLAPNYFVTSDFKKFIPVSNNQPHTGYNWMTSEIIKWKMFNGITAEGILYKPESFDPLKKYPIIFHFYEKASNGLNLWYDAETASGRINIPYFVSNNYLVFIPDIYYKIGEPGRSVYNSLVSAANFLSTKPWVDSKHMGINGHSFGGYEVNYLVTTTDIFAAASSASGVTDLISTYGTVGNYTGYHRFNTESYQIRMGGTLWNKLRAYIKNSPVLQANKVVTPLLLMIGKKDESVSPQQGIEYFSALRRLQKKTWLLEYEEVGHQGGGMDYSVRLGQFFDYYLKGKLAPKWMVEGVPARMKGVDPGFGFDMTGVKP